MCKTQTADRGDMATSKCDFDTGLVKLQGRNEEIEREYKEKVKRKEAEIEGQWKQLEEQTRKLELHEEGTREKEEVLLAGEEIVVQKTEKADEMERRVLSLEGQLQPIKKPINKELENPAMKIRGRGGTAKGTNCRPKSWN